MRVAILYYKYLASEEKRQAGRAKVLSEDTLFSVKTNSDVLPKTI